MPPRMIVIAGPPGSGKSTLFPVSSHGVDFFNADDHAAALNNGSYRNISLDTRATVNREFEAFVLGHIAEKRSFAIETTLRSGVTFDQAEMARKVGFHVEMIYVALREFDLNIARVSARARAGGHAASPELRFDIHRASMRNVVEAIRRMDLIEVHDNSGWGEEPSLVLSAQYGRVTYRTANPPGWLVAALRGSEFEFS